jgi:hypothetical protein
MSTPSRHNHDHDEENGSNPSDDDVVSPLLGDTRANESRVTVVPSPRLLGGAAPADDGQPVASAGGNSSSSSGQPDAPVDVDPTEEEMAHDTVHELPPFAFAMSILYLCNQRPLIHPFSVSS